MAGRSALESGADRHTERADRGRWGCGAPPGGLPRRQPGSGRRICGILDDARGVGDGIVGRVADLPRIARREFVDEMILAAPRDSNLTSRVLSEAQRLRLDVEIVPEFWGCSPVTEEIERVGDLALICLSAEQLPAVALLLKRLLDVMIAGAALVFLLPLLAVIAVFIKLDSPVPCCIVHRELDEKASASAALSSGPC